VWILSAGIAPQWFRKIICHAPQGHAQRNPAQGARVERQALGAQRRGCHTGEGTRAANAQDGILSLRTVRAGALAAKMPLRNVPLVTVPGRMRAAATKPADWHRPQGAHAVPGLTLPLSRRVRGSGPGMAAKQRRPRGAGEEVHYCVIAGVR